MTRKLEICFISFAVCTLFIWGYHMVLGKTLQSVVYVTNAYEVIEDLREAALSGKIEEENFMRILKDMENQIDALTNQGRNIVLPKNAVVAGGKFIRFSQDGKIIKNFETERIRERDAQKQK